MTGLKKFIIGATAAAVGGLAALASTPAQASVQPASSAVSRAYWTYIESFWYKSDCVRIGKWAVKTHQDGVTKYKCVPTDFDWKLYYHYY